MTRDRTKLVYLISLGLVVTAKFWLIQSEEIFGSWGEYDTIWYLKSASNWYWNTPYSWTAFFRTPGYPLFIAFVHMLGMPLRIGIEIFQLSGYLLIIYALRRLDYPRWLCFVVFVISTFNPCSFQVNNLTFSETAYAGALSWLVGAMMLTLAEGKIRHGFLAAGAFAFTWITREETFLLFPILALFVCALVARASLHTTSLKLALRRSTPLLLAFVSMSGGLIAAVYISNLHCFGSFSNSEMTSPEFRAAYRALTRIKPVHVVRYVPVTHESLQLAYAASPTFAKLQPALEGPIAAGWKKLTTQVLHCCEGEIGDAWFRFALRYVADQAGFHHDAKTARQFYGNVARELNRAFEQRRLPSRYVFSTFFDPGSLSFIRELPLSLQHVLSDFFRRYSISTTREEDILPAERQQLYDQMCLRRASLTQTAVVNIRFTSTNKDDPITSVASNVERQSIIPSATRFTQHDELLLFRGQNRSDGQIIFPVYHDGPVPGKLIFQAASGKQFEASPELLRTNYSDQAANKLGLPIAVTSYNYVPSYNARSIAAENWIGRKYSKLLFVLTGLGVIGAILCLARCRAEVFLRPSFAALVIIFVTVAARIALFTYLDANYYTPREPRFMFPVTSLCWTMFALVSYAGWRPWIVRFTGWIKAQKRVRSSAFASS
jgi:hypothetical protein